LLQYHRLENFENNASCLPEFSDAYRSKEHYRPDVVFLFVNGIPLCIIECKRQTSKITIPGDFAAYKKINKRRRNQNCILQSIAVGFWHISNMLPQILKKEFFYILEENTTETEGIIYALVNQPVKSKKNKTVLK
jgi:type I restriction enzyme R subunit